MVRASGRQDQPARRMRRRGGPACRRSVGKGPRLARFRPMARPSGAIAVDRCDQKMPVGRRSAAAGGERARNWRVADFPYRSFIGDKDQYWRFPLGFRAESPSCASNGSPSAGRAASQSSSDSRTVPAILDAQFPRAVSAKFTAATALQAARCSGSPRKTAKPAKPFSELSTQARFPVGAVEAAIGSAQNAMRSVQLRNRCANTADNLSVRNIAPRRQFQGLGAAWKTIRD